MKTLAILFFAATCTVSSAQTTDADHTLAHKLRSAPEIRARLAAALTAERNSGYKCFDCFMQEAEIKRSLGEFDDALRICDRAQTLATAQQLLTVTQMRGSVQFLRAESIALEDIHFSGKPSKKAFQGMQQAETTFREAVRLQPDSGSAHLNLASALMREQKDDEARKELAAVLATHDAEAVERAAKFRKRLLHFGEQFAPEFSASTFSGENVSLASLKGKVVVLDFWATWCPPCRASVPEIKNLVRQYPADRFIVLSVSNDNKESDVREFVEKHGMTWQQHFDGQGGEVTRTFQVDAFPTYILIDGDSVIRRRIVGANPQQSIVGRLKDALKEMPELQASR